MYFLKNVWNMTNSSHNKKLNALTIGAIGVVYGDIGTSPLYAIKECFSNIQSTLTVDIILGILSLIFWTLTLIVSVKYVLIILRADNNGEGGILSLTALALPQKTNKLYKYFLFLGLLGASLFYGDAVLTPAVSVLSAIEGLTVFSSNLSSYIIPVTIVVLLGLFYIQYRGTAQLGSLFGPTMLVWFIVIGGIGAYQIIQTPQILYALNPYYAYKFFHEHGLMAFTSLGSVMLAVTGAEALYADMGHFGRLSIQRAWYYFVYPCLFLNYFGQGALILADTTMVASPFFNLTPTWAVIPMVILSTFATIIASQAVISGIFSLSWQAVQLGYLPRMKVIHTSNKYIGQVFVPTANKVICLLTIALVILFRTSSNLAAAYGFAVAGIMLITIAMTAYMAISHWHWSRLKVITIFSGLFILDMTLFIANTNKVIDGGWLPLIIAVVVMAVMTTWVRGRVILSQEIATAGKTLKNFIKHMGSHPPIRVPGNAVYMNSCPENLPNAFTINLRHNKVLHEKVIFLSFVTKGVPHVLKKDKVKVKNLGFDIYQVVCTIGFKDSPSVAYIFDRCHENNLHIDITDTTFFMSRGIPVSSISPHIARWRERLFIFLARNAATAIDYYKIPYNRVVELGIRLKL